MIPNENRDLCEKDFRDQSAAEQQRYIKMASSDCELCWTDEDPASDLAEPMAVFAALAPRWDGDKVAVRLIRSTWIRRQARLIRAARLRGESTRSLALKRRQEMPTDAFIGPLELFAPGARGDQPKGLISIPGGDLSVDGRRSRVPVAAVSYCWRTPEHPDPDGDTLLLVADCLEEIYRLKAAEHGYILNPYKNFPDELGIFFDFASLYQHPEGGRRTEEEDRLFKSALGSLEVWYAHESTTVFLLTGTGVDKGYFERGWPTYESMVASLIKKRQSGIHATWDPVIVVDASDGSRASTRAIPMAKEGSLNTRLMAPPTSCAAFRELLPKLHFTNGSDRDMVGDIYERTLRKAFGSVESLVYQNQEWDNTAVVKLASSLSFCQKVTVVDLSFNHIGDVGVTALATAMDDGALPSLRKLHLEYNAISAKGLEALACPVGQLIHLETLELSGNPLGTAPAGLAALGRGAFPSLRSLQLYRCNVSGRSLRAFADALLQGALPSLEEVNLQQYEQGTDENADQHDIGEGFEAFADALARGAMANLEKIKGDELETQSVQGGYGWSRAKTRRIQQILNSTVAGTRWEWEDVVACTWQRVAIASDSGSQSDEASDESSGLVLDQGVVATLHEHSLREARRAEKDNVCDSCGTQGIRFRCAQGCDFDLCQSCVYAVVFA